MRNPVTKTYQKKIIACALLLMLTNCCTIPKTNAQPLAVENHECVLKNYTHVTSMVLPLYVSIDLPVQGPQPLMDSLTDFLNETLYHYFDNGDDRHLPYQTVYSKDIRHLIEHYKDTYKRFFLPDSTELHEFSTDCLEMKLAAQNDNYITYEVDWIFFGEGEEVAKEWVTFVLADGHRLTKVISNKNMLKFYRKHPELRSEDVWRTACLYDRKSCLVGSVGLLNDAVAHQYVYAPGIFEEVIKYPLDAIAPYLSKEAKSLMSKRN